MHTGHDVVCSAAIFRYIDDILALNVDFEHRIAEIYGNSLKVNKEGTIDNGIDYLDLSFRMGSRRTTVYNKTDKFPFKAKRLFDASSCVPPSMVKGICTGQIARFCSLTCHHEDFAEAIRNLRDCLVDNGHRDTILLSCLLRFYENNSCRFWKYKILTKRAFKRRILDSLWR